jgi:hypothetical protein
VKGNESHSLWFGTACWGKNNLRFNGVLYSCSPTQIWSQGNTGTTYFTDSRWLFRANDVSEEHVLSSSRLLRMGSSLSTNYHTVHIQSIIWQRYYIQTHVTWNIHGDRITRSLVGRSAVTMLSWYPTFQRLSLPQSSRTDALSVVSARSIYTESCCLSRPGLRGTDNSAVYKISVPPHRLASQPLFPSRHAVSASSGSQVPVVQNTVTRNATMSEFFVLG